MTQFLPHTSPLSTAESIHFSVVFPDRLDSLLTLSTRWSRSYIQEQISLGQVKCNGQVVLKNSYKPRYRDEIHAHFNGLAPLKAHPVEGPLDILFEDEHFLVLNKAAGITVHPVPKQTEVTLVHFLLNYLNSAEFHSLCPLRPGIVHRLDKGTSGLLLVAKNAISLEALSALFKNRTIKKHYECLVWGKTPTSGIINLPIGRSIVDRKKFSAKTHSPRNALTHFHTRHQLPHTSLLDVEIFTGRTHQIRVHLSEEAGFPIVNDSTYGKRAMARYGSRIPERSLHLLDRYPHPLLHAARLEFVHPITCEPMKFSCRRPEEFDAVIKSLDLSP